MITLQSSSAHSSPPKTFSFPYLLDRPGCRSVRAARSTGHGFQFSALDGFA
jgi:hypothetical protein